MKLSKQQLRAGLISLLFSLLAILLANYIPSINSIILGLFIGLIAGNFFSFGQEYKQSFSYIGSKALELAIVFLAFSINYNSLKATGPKALIFVALVVLGVILTSKLLGKLFRCRSSIAWQIGFGTAICGSSAIAAIAPSVSEDKDDTAVAMAVVNLLGTLGMIVLPVLLMQLPLDSNIQSLIIGGGLHSVGNVAGAAYSMETTVGEMALTIKLARVALLSPALILFNLVMNRNKAMHWSKMIQLPWYLIAFIAITLFITFIPVPQVVQPAISTTGKFLLTLAMVAIGLNLRLSKLLQSAKKGLLFGMTLFVVQLALIGLLIAFMY